jgi:hypothetical protein
MPSPGFGPCMRQGMAESKTIAPQGEKGPGDALSTRPTEQSLHHAIFYISKLHTDASLVSPVSQTLSGPLSLRIRRSMRMLSATEFLTRLCPWACLAVSVRAGRGLPATDMSMHGPVYLPPSGADFRAFTEARDRTPAAVKDSVANETSNYGPVDGQTTPFSVQVFRTSSDRPLLDYHLEGP